MQYSGCVLCSCVTEGRYEPLTHRIESALIGYAALTCACESEISEYLTSVSYFIRNVELDHN